jgi:hypothetical protein
LTHSSLVYLQFGLLALSLDLKFGWVSVLAAKLLELVVVELVLLLAAWVVLAVWVAWYY